MFGPIVCQDAGGVDELKQWRAWLEFQCNAARTSKYEGFKTELVDDLKQCPADAAGVVEKAILCQRML